MTDAELAGVAGGGKREDFATKVVQLCYCECPGGEHCSGSRGQLITYLREHGKDSVKDYHYCPYYRP